MSKLLALVCGVFLFVSVGCQDQNNDDRMMKGDKMNASADACPHCPGIQKARADGTCPECNAKLGSASTASTRPAAMSTGADVCTHCAGVQTATADGKCPMCGADVAMKK